MLRKIWLTACSFFVATCVFAADLPAYEDFVTDLSGSLDSSTEQILNEKLASYEAETGTEIAIAIVDLIGQMPAWEYATELGNAWGVGKAGVDNGVVFLIETGDVAGERDVFIATGSQTEGGLTDLEANIIVDEIVIPRFRAGDFGGGVTAGTDAIIAALDGESWTELRSHSTVSNHEKNLIFISHSLTFFTIFILPTLGAILGRSREIYSGGIIGGFAGGFFGAFWGFAVLGVLGSAVGMAVLGVIFDAIVSREYQSAKATGRKVRWWAGGSGGRKGGGGGFGGFGGGGFSGGGGGGKW